ncbi:MAG: DUF2203 domain-containing protein [Pyrinomonas sp.]|uniref:DUF2203 domain-containing protein n=1 Tax=Pyrinomonas sp. TaxID=2080306 RepID=UPI003324ACEF
MKLFTIEEANRLLPTVRAILVELQKVHGRLRTLRDRARLAADKANWTGGVEGGTAYAAALVQLSEKMAELGALGVQLKDLDRGLVDFPHMRDGRVVLLCWHMGEGDRIQWWHEWDAGFAGRQPL